LFTAAGARVVALNVGTFVRSQVVQKEGGVVRKLPSYPVANTAVSAAAFADSLAILRSASILTSSRDLRTLQGNLSALRFYQGPLDGRFGTRMRAAIHAYEARRGAPATGLPTGALLRQLKGTTSVSHRHP
jgi:peptidoglycan hydrolase-like protein with peptidoglycan-binding domain